MGMSNVEFNPFEGAKTDSWKDKTKIFFSRPLKLNHVEGLFEYLTLNVPCRICYDTKTRRELTEKSGKLVRAELANWLSGVIETRSERGLEDYIARFECSTNILLDDSKAIKNYLKKGKGDYHGLVFVNSDGRPIIRYEDRVPEGLYNKIKRVTLEYFSSH